MYRVSTILLCTCFFFSISCRSQQYPFIPYSTKDGLVSNLVTGIFQDDRGRLFFLTYNGFSTYDGARFTNYTTADGLPNEVVNDVMQMGDDSFWVATNTNEVTCLVHGKIEKLITADGYCPIVNQLYRNAAGKLFAASDEGVFIFENNRFTHLSFLNDSEKNVGVYITHIQAVNQSLMLVQSVPAETNSIQTLFLYDYIQQKIIASTSAMNFVLAPDSSFWVMKAEGIRKLEINDLLKNELHLISLSPVYKKIARNITGIIFFDRDGNCWLSGKDDVLAKCDKQGNITTFPSQNLFYQKQSNAIFQDKEGILWFCFAQNGVSKLSVTNLSLLNLYGLHYTDIGYSNGTLLLYDAEEKKLVLQKDFHVQIFAIGGKTFFSGIYLTRKGLFGIALTDIYKLVINGNYLQPVKIEIDKNFTQDYGKALEDNYGNLIIAGNKYLTAVIDGNRTVNAPVYYFADQLAKDKAGNIWLANRKDNLMQFSLHPEKPERYLQLESHYNKAIPQLDARSACFDSSGNLWIGTRYKGLFCLNFSNHKMSMLHFTKKQGLSDNFNSFLTCDAENNIWACSPTGLDKVSFKDNKIAVTNITQQSNLYQQISTLAFDRDSTAWVLGQTGSVIKITHQQQNETNYKPKLYLTYIKSGKDTLYTGSAFKFSYLNNNPSFYFAATSFLNERQIQYSYRLQGSYNTPWSETSTNAFINFINLAPGNYVLQAKVSYPAEKYAEQIIRIPFQITPPWWKTKWFTFALIVSGAVILFVSIRLYVRRKLEKQRIELEKKQAVEKERTRIATDMHDDLGAGLSRIKFLSETINLKKQLQQPVEQDILKIKEYAHEMIGKMDEIVWALNEKNDSLTDLLSYIRVYAMEYLTQNGILCSVASPENFPSTFVTGEMRRNIFLTVKESLHNIVKHAKASNVLIEIRNGNNIIISIADDGIGFDKNNLRAFSNGIHNMQKRIKEVGGTIEIKNDKGTIVSFEVPLQV